MAVDKDRLFKKLEHVGEMVVRENLANGVYGENRRGLVEEWLKQREDTSEAEARREEQRAEEILESAPEPNQSAPEEDRRLTPEIPSDKWYRRLLVIVGLVVLAGLIIYLISFAV